MLIVLDYDETYTAAPVLWDSFITMSKEHGHIVVCCTMRPSSPYSFNEDVITDMAQHGVEIVYAADHADKWEAMQKAGYQPENAIWIDDRPMFIFLNRTKEEYQELP